MVRISKLTDYAVVIMAHIAGVSMANPSTLLQAKEIAKDTHLAFPTVSKLLKALTKHQFLHSSRGTHGGYQLAITPDKVSIVDLIQALEGPLAITECNLGHKHCSSETQCAIRKPWLHINQIITQSLAQIKLSNIINMNNHDMNIDDMDNHEINNYVIHSIHKKTRTRNRSDSSATVLGKFGEKP